jgi:hypothetical protein
VIALRSGDPEPAAVDLLASSLPAIIDPFAIAADPTWGEKLAQARRELAWAREDEAHERQLAASRRRELK